MDKMTKILFLAWCVLALAAFVSSFWAPLLIKIIGIAFGSMNLIIMGVWVASLIEGRLAYKKAQKALKELKEEK